MSRKSLLASLVLLFTGLFVLSWQLYPLLLRLMLPHEVDVAATSLEEALRHRFWSVLPIATFGALLGGGAWMITGSAPRGRTYLLAVLVLAMPGLLAAAARLGFAARSFPSPEVDGGLPVLLPIAAVPLHQVGIAACIGVVLSVAVLKLVRRRRASAAVGSNTRSGS